MFRTKCWGGGESGGDGAFCLCSGNDVEVTVIAVVMGPSVYVQEIMLG